MVMLADTLCSGIHGSRFGHRPGSLEHSNPSLAGLTNSTEPTPPENAVMLSHMPRRWMPKNRIQPEGESAREKEELDLNQRVEPKRR